MKHILITGKNGYISTALSNWIKKKNPDIEIDILDLLDPSWVNTSFAGVETIIHTAALVHKNEKDHSLDEYRKVNTQLTVDIAQKAKNAGVSQFIFMSTMAVYGIEPSLTEDTIINEETLVKPITKYGISKLEAEIGLKKLEDNNFKVVIIRPPFVYGKNCPGNYQLLKKLTLKFHFIPKIDNKKSMLYIDNLCELIYQLYVNKSNGTFMPQNTELPSTTELSKLIAENNNAKVWLTGFFNPLIFLLSKKVGKLKKAFGNEYYSESLSVIKDINYNAVGFENSVKNTEQ